MTAPVIVSMTTVPARNGTVGPIVGFLRGGRRPPDEIRVYLTPGCDRVPGARCIEVADLGPVTKLSAVADPGLPDDAIVVTCDDDQIYDPRWLETLVDAAQCWPDCAVGLSGWNTRGFLLGERGRDHYEWVRPHSPCDVLEGFAGVAYRRGFFGADVWNVPESCRFVDDVWISGYLHKKGIARRLVGAKLCRPAPSDRAGLHARKDFVALNRAAARELFGEATTSALPSGRAARPGEAGPCDLTSALPSGRAARPGEAGPCDLTSALPSGSAARPGEARPCDLTSALPSGSAARPGEAGPCDPAPTENPTLSILIPSLASRAPLLARLRACLARQGRASEIEILTDVDDGQATTGTKRNRLVARARGAYLCHVDDDDLVAPDYLDAILAAIAENPGVDAVWIRGQRRIVDGEEAGVLPFDYGCPPSANGRVSDDGTLWRSAGHLCPIRAAIAKATPFPELTVGEDLRWANAVAPKIRTSARAGRAGQVLYYYEFDPHKKTQARPQGSQAEVRITVSQPTNPARPTPSAPPAPPAPTTPRTPRRARARDAEVRVARGGVHLPAPAVNAPTLPAGGPQGAATPGGGAKVGERSDVSPDGVHAAIFAVQYTEASGPGSALSVTVPYRAFLEEFIRERGVASIVDLGCGDLEIMSHVDLAGARYLGVDVIAERVRRNGKKLEGRPQFTFNVGDARALPMGNLANFDLLIIKDVLQHWTNTEVAAWLARWQFAVQGPRYALVTNCNYGPTVNRDVAAGGWRAIDLTRAPFGVGKVVLRWALPRGPHVDYKDVVLLERA